MFVNELTGEKELTVPEAAEYLGCTKGFLSNDRSGKRRIPYIKVAGKIRYRLTDLEALKTYHPAMSE